MIPDAFITEWKEYITNLEAKMKDKEFLGDISGILRPDVKFNMTEAFELVKKNIIEKM